MVEDGPDVEFGYVPAEPCGRRKLRWLGLLVIFAFVEPAHLRRSIKCRVPSLPRLYLVFHMTLQHLDLGITSRRGGINCCDDVRNAQLNAAPPPDSQHNDRDFAACDVLGNECSYRLLPARRTRRPRPRQGDRHFPIRRRLCTMGREGENGVNLFPRDAELLGQFVHRHVFLEYRRNRGSGFPETPRRHCACRERARRRDIKTSRDLPESILASPAVGLVKRPFVSS